MRRAIFLLEVSYQGAEATCAPAADTGCGPVEVCDCPATIVEEHVMLQAQVDTDGSDLTITLGQEVIPGQYCVDEEAGELWIHATRFGAVDIHWRLRRLSP